jgi:hypothetical protein
MATSTTLVKTAAQALLALTQQATATVTIGSAVDVSTKLGPATAFVKMGRTVATALTNEVTFRLEGSAKTTGNDEWVPIYSWTSGTGKTAASSTTLNGATTAGNTTTVLTAGTGFSAGVIAYVRETGTPANSEWSRVASLSTNTVTWEEAQTRSHTTGIAATTLAEEYAIPMDLSGQVRVRLVVDTASAASGQTVDILAWLVTADSAATA